MNPAIETLPLPPRISLDLSDAIPLEPVAILSQTMRLRLITRQCFGLDDVKAARIVAAMGELKVHDKKPVLLPSTISKGRYANWISGKTPMPLWRLGAAVAAFEFYVLEKCALYRARGLGPDDPRLKMFNIGLEQLRAYSDDPRLTGWLPKFRAAILQRLELDARKDKNAKAQLARWSAFLEDIAKEKR